MGERKDFEMLQQKVLEKQVVEPKVLEKQVVEPKVLEIQVLEQKDLVILVIIITNLVDIMPPKHKMEVYITICVILNTKAR